MRYDRMTTGIGGSMYFLLHLLQLVILFPFRITVFVSKIIFALATAFYRQLKQYSRELFVLLSYYVLSLCLFLLSSLVPRRKKVDTIPLVTVTQHSDRVWYLMMKLSLEYFSNQEFSFVAIDDGSLTAFDRHLLERYRVTVYRSVSRQFQKKKYTDLKTLFPHRQIMLIDSDVLFFAHPKQLLTATTAVYMQDFKSMYSLSNEEIAYLFGITPVEKLNAGLIKLHTDLIDLKILRRVEEGVEQTRQSRIMFDYFLEQTAYAIVMAQHPSQALTDSYFLLGRKYLKQEAIPRHPVCIHYTGRFLHDLAWDAISLLITTHFFTSSLKLAR